MSAAPVLVLLAALSATPERGVGVLVARRVGVSKPEAALVAAQVVSAMQAASVEPTLSAAQAAQGLAALGVSDAEVCEGKRDCVAQLGAKLGLAAVISVEVGAMGRSVAVHLEALEVTTARRLAQHDVLAAKEALRQLSGLDPFAAEVRAALAELAPPPPPRLAADAPKELRVVAARPALEEIPPEALATAPADAGTHTAGYVLVGGAAAAAVAAITCGLVGYLQQRSLEPGADRQLPLTRAQAQDRADLANGLYSASLATGILAAGLGTTAAIVW